jgi:ATP-binding cassette, subfamily B, bacterial MsbA
MSGFSTAPLLKLARQFPAAVPAVVVLGILASLAEGIGIGLLIPLLNELFGATPSSTAGPLGSALAGVASWIPESSRLVTLGVVVFSLIGLKTGLMIVLATLSTRLAERIAHGLRDRLAEALLHSDFAVSSRIDRGELVTLCENQTDRLAIAMLSFCALLGAISTAGVFLLLLSLLSWKLTVSVILVFLPVSLGVRILSRRVRRSSEAVVESWRELSNRILEVIASQRTIRLFNSEPEELLRFSAASRGVQQAKVREGIIVGSVQHVVEFFYLPVFFVVLGLALRLEVDLTVLFAFLALLYRLQAPLKRIDHLRVELASVEAVHQSLERTLGVLTAHPMQEGTRTIDRLSSGITFDRVTFGYHGTDVPALADVTLSIAPGEVVALLGPSGSGKSTLVNLLCRLYDPSSGEIRVDGIPLAELRLRSWRKLIGFAGQDADLMLGSIRDNVALGLPSARDEDIWEALRLAHADTFVRALPQGLETPVGPGGRNLSGGQRQRLALARAFIRRPDLVILDEATSAVDNSTEVEIQDAIDRLAVTSTVIVIAHRLGTVRRADRVLILEGGRIVESGTPADLMEGEGYLARQNALR